MFEPFAACCVALGMGFFETLKSAWGKSGDDDIGILAAGISYYAFLSMVPLLTAAVLGYGLFADPAAVAEHIAGLADRLPQAVAELVGGQLESMVETSNGVKGFGLALSLGLALFGARASAATLVRAVSIVIGDGPRRGFVRSNLVAGIALLGVLAGGGAVIGSIAATAYLVNMLPDSAGATRLIGQIVTQLVLAGIASAGLAMLYRRAPTARRPGWRAALPGAVVASIGIVVLTAAFGFYVANFGSYNATYGSLGAVVVLLTWLYLTAYVILFGAEVTAVRTR